MSNVVLLLHTSIRTLCGLKQSQFIIHGERLSGAAGHIKIPRSHGTCGPPGQWTKNAKLEDFMRSRGEMRVDRKTSTDRCYVEDLSVWWMFV